MDNTTPRPWKWETGSKTIRSVPANYWLATMDSWDGQVNNDANAELIVTAVNSFDAMREALIAAQSEIGRMRQEMFGNNTQGPVQYRITAALALAQGQQKESK